MTFIEFLGFVISLGAMIFLVVKRAWDERQKRRNPKLYAEKQARKEKMLNDLLKSMHDQNGSRQKGNKNDRLRAFDEDFLEEEEEEEWEEIESPRLPQRISLPPTPPKQKAQPSFTPQKQSSRQPPIGSLQDSYQEKIVSRQFLEREASAYDIDQNRTFVLSRAAKVVEALPSAKNMVIIKEILGPPVCMRPAMWKSCEQEDLQ